MSKKKSSTPKKGVRDVPQQKLRLFAEHYSSNPNAADAAAAAGYKGTRKRLSNTGTELLKRPDVQRMLADITDAALAEKPGIMNREQRQQFWSDVMRGAVKFPKVVVDVEGNAHEVDAPPSENARLKASELLGKAQGDFVERREHKITGEVTIFTVEMPRRETPPEPDA